MTTQYTPTLKLALPVTGELSGTWGDVVNDNITSMIEQAIAGLSTINTWTGNAHTLTTANGTTSESRCAMLVAATGAGGTALTGAGEIICPAAAKLYVVQNTTAFVVTLKTSAGTGVAVAAGNTAFLFCDATNVNSCVTTIVDGNITGNLTVGGNATINGNTTLGNATSDTITATARFNSDLLPSTDNARDLGSAANAWKDLFIDGTATMALVAISGGTINGVSIGATTAATIINVDNLRLDGNTISSTDTNGNVVIAPNGTGDVQLDADTVRVGDAAAAATLTSNGAGALTVTTGGAADLTLSTNSGTTSGTVVIANGVNGNITLTPDGTGDVILSADRVQIGDSNTDTTLTTNGTGSLNLTTNNGSNSGTIQIAQGVNGNITLTPNGTGSVSVPKLVWSNGTATRVPYLTTGGQFIDSANLTFNGTDLTVSGAVNAGSINATTLDLTNLEVTNIKAKDGTASITLADSTGVASFTANPVLSGGTANGVLYLNGSKSATSGSALTFNGTTVGINTAIGNSTSLSITGDYTPNNTATFIAVQRLGGAVAGAWNYSDAQGVIQFGTTTNHALVFLLNNTEKARFDNNGVLLVGKNSNSTYAAGSALFAVNGGTDNGVAIAQSQATGPFMTFFNSANSGYASISQPAAGTLGITSSTALVFEVNSARRMTISSAGYVGINTSTSTLNQYLTINGSGGSLAGTAAIALWDANSGGSRRWAIANGASAVGGDQIGALTFNVGSGNLNADPLSAGAEVMRITLGGYVGINTANTTNFVTPQTWLDVRGPNIAIGATALATAQGQAFIGTSTGWGQDIGGSLALGGTQNSGTLTATYASISGRRESSLGYIYTGYMQFGVSDGANVVERMRITSAGNLFVGLTGYPTGFGNGKIVAQQSNAGTYGILSFASSGSTQCVYIGHDGTNGYIGTTYGSGSSFTPLVFQTSDTERARITSTGLVAIGNPDNVALNGWSSSNAIQVGKSANFYGDGIYYNWVSGLSLNSYRSANVWYNTSASIPTGRFEIGNGGTGSVGGFAWYWGTGGSAGAAAAQSQFMTLDTSGRLIVGATSWTGGKFLVVGGSASPYSATSWQGSNATAIRLSSGGTPVTGDTTGISISVGGNAEAYIGAVQNSSNYADIVFQGFAGSYQELARISSAGNLTTTGTIGFGSNAANTALKSSTITNITAGSSQVIYTTALAGNSGAYMMVRGVDASGNWFCDFLTFLNSNTTTLLAGMNGGSPGSRTYSVAAGTLSLNPSVTQTSVRVSANELSL